MQSNNEKDSEEVWLANMEEEYLASMAAEPDYEREYVTDRESSMSAMWGGFQESATSIAQLYRDRLNTNETGALWIPFQTAAGTVTSLYKESSDSLKRTSEKAIHCGYQRRTREISEWVRKKNRRYIRREELLAYLAGKPAPPLHAPKGTSSPHHNHHPHHHPHQTVHHSPLNSGRNHHGSQGLHLNHNNTFKEARRPRTPELYAFVSDELARHTKRPGSPLDINMDVPCLASKRPRFL